MVISDGGYNNEESLVLLQLIAQTVLCRAGHFAWCPCENVYGEEKQWLSTLFVFWYRMGIHIISQTTHVTNPQFLQSTPGNQSRRRCGQQ